MPLDFTSFTIPLPLDATSRADVQIGRLAALERALRAEMPEEWEWDYGRVASATRCGTAGCALGLAHHIGLIPWDREFVRFAFSGRGLRAFGLSQSETTRAFASPTFYGVDWSAVTPAMVADAIAAIIAREIAADSRADSRAEMAECVA